MARLVMLFRLLNFANSLLSASAWPILPMALSNACCVSVPDPTCCSTSSRRWLSSSFNRSAFLIPSPVICRRQFLIASSRSNILLLPERRQNRMDRRPFLALRVERPFAVLFNRIIFALAAVLSGLPTRTNPAPLLHPVQHRIKHPIRPLHPLAGSLLYLLDNRIP